MKYLATIILLLTSCGPQNYQPSIQEQDILSPEYTRDLITGKQEAPNPETAKKQLNTQLGKWFYGHGVGRTILNVGTIVVFPPWALYLIGNAGIELAGYEPLYLTNALPEEPKKGFLEFYDITTSLPGRLNATIADKTFVESPSYKNERKEHNRHSSQTRTLASKGNSSATY